VFGILHGPQTHEDEGNMFVRNIKNHLFSEAASHPRRLETLVGWQVHTPGILKPIDAKAQCTDAFVEESNRLFIICLQGSNSCYHTCRHKKEQINNKYVGLNECMIIQTRYVTNTSYCNTFTVNGLM
jgi:hypothetical protein